MVMRLLLVISLLCPHPANAADSCYPKFRDPLDKIIGWVAQDCNALEKDEPSNCQRSCGDRCQKSYNELRRIRGEICNGLASDADFVKSRQYTAGVDSQKDAQDANAALNSDTAEVSEGMATTLKGESAKLTNLIKDNEAVIRSEYCVRSSNYPVLSNRMKVLNDNLAAARALLDTLAAKKKKDAVQANTVAAISERRSQELSSVNPVVIGKEDSFGDKAKKWVVPALVAGGAAALLYAVLKKKDKGSPTPAADLGPAGETPDNTPGPGGSTPSPGNEQPAAPYAGDPSKFFETNGVRVDPAFSDASKRQIAAAVNYFPECQRRYLAGTIIRSNPRLVWQSSSMAGRCLPGKNVSMNPPTIELNDTCQTGMGTHSALVVHELMHVLANRRGYYVRYRQAFNANPGCGVSRYSHQFYGGRNINEDFAEAGRFVVFPASGQMYSGSCVNNRVAAVREIINSCR